MSHFNIMEEIQPTDHRANFARLTVSRLPDAEIRKKFCYADVRSISFELWIGYVCTYNTRIKMGAI